MKAVFMDAATCIWQQGWSGTCYTADCHRFKGAWSNGTGGGSLPACQQLHSHTGIRPRHPYPASSHLVQPTIHREDSQLDPSCALVRRSDECTARKQGCSRNKDGCTRGPHGTSGVACGDWHPSPQEPTQLPAKGRTLNPSPGGRSAALGLHFHHAHNNHSDTHWDPGEPTQGGAGAPIGGITE